MTRIARSKARRLAAAAFPAAARTGARAVAQAGAAAIFDLGRIVVLGGTMPIEAAREPVDDEDTSSIAQTGDEPVIDAPALLPACPCIDATDTDGSAVMLCPRDEARHGATLEASGGRGTMTAGLRHVGGDCDTAFLGVSGVERVAADTTLGRAGECAPGARVSPTGRINDVAGRDAADARGFTMRVRAARATSDTTSRQLGPRFVARRRAAGASFSYALDNPKQGFATRARAAWASVRGSGDAAPALARAGAVRARGPARGRAAAVAGVLAALLAWTLPNAPVLAEAPGSGPSGAIGAATPATGAGTDAGSEKIREKIRDKVRGAAPPSSATKGRAPDAAAGSASGPASGTTGFAAPVPGTGTGAAPGGVHAGQPPSPPARVVSINLCTDQLAMLLAAPGQLVSVSSLARDPVSSAMAEAALAYPANHARAEEVFVLRPGLVLAGRYSSTETVDMLRRLGLPVATFDPAGSLDDVRRSIARMGTLLGREPQAAKLVADFDARLAALRAPGVVASQAAPHAPKKEGRPRAVLYHPNGYATGDATLAGAIAAAAGFANAATETGLAGGGIMPLEVLAMAAPDAVITSRPYPGASRSEEVMAHPVVRALQSRAAMGVVTDRDWICGTPAVLDAVAATTRLRRAVEAAR